MIKILSIIFLLISLVSAQYGSIGAWVKGNSLGAWVPYADDAPPVPIVTVNPSNISKEAGELCTLFVDGSDITSYQWQYREAAGSWADSAQTGQRWIFTLAAHHDDDSARCIVSNVTGADTSTAARIDTIIITDTLVPHVWTPKTTYTVGELAIFSAESTTYLGGYATADSGKYEWDFSDGCFCKFDWPTSSNDCQQRVMGHYFMTPGTYNVKMKVLIYNTFSSNIPTGDPRCFDSIIVPITVEGTKAKTGFALHHATFSHRSEIFVYADIPTSLRANTNKLVVTYDGDEIFNESNLSAVETLTVDRYNKGIGRYSLVARILNASDVQVDSCYIVDFDTIATVDTTWRIDKWNSFRKNGEYDFKVMAFQDDTTNLKAFRDSGIINGAWTQSTSGNNYTPTSYGAWLTTLANKGLDGVGSGWNGYGTGFSRLTKSQQAMLSGKAWLDTSRNHSNSAIVILLDEPNIDGAGGDLLQTAWSAFQYYYYTNAPSSMFTELLAWHRESPNYTTTATKWDYNGNSDIMGGRGWLPEILSGDIYIHKSRNHASLNSATSGPVWIYYQTVDSIVSWNRNLSPFIPVLQPCEEIFGDLTTPPPTDSEVYSMAWLSVIHGAKGVLWFIHFDASTRRWDAMQRFYSESQQYKDIFLSPPSALTVTDNSNDKLNRVDNLIRQVGDTCWVFSARLTEPDTIEEPYTGPCLYKGVEPENITTTLSVSGFTYDTVQTVDGNGIALSGDEWTEDYDKNEVVIYKLWDAPEEVLPTILQDPIPALVPTDQQHVFYVVAADAVSYQWQDSIGVTISNRGSNNDTLLFAPSVTYSDSGRSFRCIVSNHSGSDTSAWAELTVIPFTIDTNIVGNGTMTVTPGVSGLEENTRIYFNAVADQGWQWVSYTGIGEDSLTSAFDSLTLTASVAVGVIFAQPPLITTQPQPVSKYIDSLCTLTVAGNGITNYRWQIKDSGSGLWVDSAGATSSSMSFTMTAAKNGDSVRVIVGNAYLFDTSNSVMITTLTTVAVRSIVTPRVSMIDTGTIQFTVTFYDTTGAVTENHETVVWSTTASGATQGNINSSSGLFTAGTSFGGPYTVTATAGSVVSTASVTVSNRASSGSRGGWGWGW